MFGFELVKARSELRRELRRAAILNLGTAVALDLEHLALMLDDGSYANYAAVVRRRLLLRGAATLGLESAALAAAVGMDGAGLERETKAALLADPGIAQGIEAAVLVQLPETPEPGRFKAPVL